MKKYSLNRICLWVITNSATAWCVWEAVINKSAGAINLLVFGTWVFVVSALFVVFSDEAKGKMASKGRSVPAVLSHGLGVIFVCFLAWNGWWFTAIGFLFLENAEALIYSKDDPK